MPVQDTHNAIKPIHEVVQQAIVSREYLEQGDYNFKIYEPIVDRIETLIEKSTTITKNDQTTGLYKTERKSLLRQRIDQSKSLLNLRANWDDENALPVNRQNYEEAIQFLNNYAERVVDVMGKEFPAPHINAVKDGSIDLEWNLSNSYLLINMNSESAENAIYYLAFKKKDEIDWDANGYIKKKDVTDKFADILVGLS